MPRPSLPDLPVAETFDALRAALDRLGRAVLVAPPGAGKTTIVPLALLDEKWLAGNKILVLEPRRLATRAAARRMAELLGERVGETVGYQTRDEREIGINTVVEVVTEGILTRRLQNDPELHGVGLVIFDEVHERNLPTDIGLALTLDVIQTLRPDLRILAMSATPDTASLCAALGDATIVESAGRLHPVEIRWLPRGRNDRIEDVTVAAITLALREQSGDVLVFLPGIGEITRTNAALQRVVAAHVDIRELAGALTLAEQDLALEPSPPGRRRVVLATDIAETSLTVEGVHIVIDSGLARSPRFDVSTGMTRLKTITTSRSSAEQRTGRAGRLGPGVCYRLWSKIEHGTRQTHRSPEIDEVDLAGLALELAAWGTSADALTFISKPPRKALDSAHELLRLLDALDDVGRITEVGRVMLKLPVHPRLARMLVAEPTSLGCVLAVLIDERDVLRGRPGDLPSDLSLRVRLVVGRGIHDQADHRSVQHHRNRAQDLARRIGIRFDPDLVDADRAGAVLLSAFPDRLAARRRPGQFQLRTGAGAWLPESDVLATEPFVVAADLDGKRTSARIRLAAAIDASDVALAFGDAVQETVVVAWDADRDDLVERVERRLGAMRFGETKRPATPSAATSQALLERIRVTGLAALGWSASSLNLRRRVDFLNRTIGAPWPDWSQETLARTIDSWLEPYLVGICCRADLERIDLTIVLQSMLPWPESADLESLAPASLALPTGRVVPIDYTDDRPIARVRVQDLFGVTIHPLAGTQPITLHLLSPADRPIQITSDLPGFWKGSWSEVRKDLAGRYAKHQWPMDPASATPRRMKDK